MVYMFRGNTTCIQSIYNYNNWLVKKFERESEGLNRRNGKNWGGWTRAYPKADEALV
jgi:hypothetical protein